MHYRNRAFGGTVEFNPGSINLLVINPESLGFNTQKNIQPVFSPAQDGNWTSLAYVVATALALGGDPLTLNQDDQVTLAGAAQALHDRFQGEVSIEIQAMVANTIIDLATAGIDTIQFPEMAAQDIPAPGLTNTGKESGNFSNAKQLLKEDLWFFFVNSQNQQWWLAIGTQADTLVALSLTDGFRPEIKCFPSSMSDQLYFTQTCFSPNSLKSQVPGRYHSGQISLSLDYPYPNE